jgi:hypothetical protein
MSGSSPRWNMQALMKDFKFEIFYGGSVVEEGLMHERERE